MPAELLKSRSQWKDIEQVKRVFLPESASYNLYDTTSLTTKIKAHCRSVNKPFSVLVINEEYGKPTLNEQKNLRMRNGLFARIREIYLLCGEEKIIYARSIIPVSTMTGRQRQIKFLKNRALGAYLFSDRSLRREITQIAKATNSKQAKPIWGRRSVFDVDNKPLLVAEWFLKDEVYK